MPIAQLLSVLPWWGYMIEQLSGADAETVLRWLLLSWNCHRYGGNVIRGRWV